MFLRGFVIYVNINLIMCMGFVRESRDAGFLAHKFVPGECSAQRREFNMNMRQSSCKPRDTLVPLITDLANVMIYPNKATVKRCDGATCYGQASCLPTAVRNVPYAVRKHDFRTGSETCGVVYVEEHTQCKCGCSVMESHCTHMQVYRPRECMCVCLNAYEEEECTQSDRIWDPRTCSCNCKVMFPDCTTGTEWIPSMCRCMGMSDLKRLFYN